MQDDVWVLVTIFYKDQDQQKVEFLFYFDTSDKNMLRFLNQPYLVWKKESGITT